MNQKKRRGRPATGSDPMWGIRFTLEQRKKIEAFAEQNNVARAEAIRRLVEKGLKSR